MKEYTPHTHVTHVLLALNVLVYLVMVASGVDAFSPSADVLLAWGGDYGPRTTTGQWWRLVTSAFVHGGVFHLFGNMLFFWYIGRFMERLVGQAGYAVLYLGSAVAGSLASLVWDASVVSVGASGALFGLFGGVLGFVVRRDRDRVAQGVLRAVKNAAIAFLAWQILFGMRQQGIDHAAHVGGALGGLCLGYLLGHPLTADGVARRVRRAWIAAGVGLACAVGVFALLPRYGDFQAYLLDYVALEERALPLYRRGTTRELDHEAFAKALEEEILPGYEGIRARQPALDTLPRRHREVAAALERYSALRIEAFRLRLESLRADDPEKSAAAARESDRTEREAAGALQGLARARR